MNEKGFTATFTTDMKGKEATKELFNFSEKNFFEIHPEAKDELDDLTMQFMETNKDVFDDIVKKNKHAGEELVRNFIGIFRNGVMLGWNSCYDMLAMAE